MLQEETATLASGNSKLSNNVTSLTDVTLDTTTEHHAKLVAAIQDKMSELGLNATQLAVRIGFSKSKVSEILNRKRPLSKRMAKALYGIGIDAEVLFNALIDVH